MIYFEHRDAADLTAVRNPEPQPFRLPLHQRSGLHLGPAGLCQLMTFSSRALPSCISLSIVFPPAGIGARRLRRIR